MMVTGVRNEGQPGTFERQRGGGGLLRHGHWTSWLRRRHLTSQLRRGSLTSQLRLESLTIQLRRESLTIPLRHGSLTGRLKHDVGWAPAEPPEARRPLEPAKAWKTDELPEAPPFPSATAPGPNVTNQNKNQKVSDASFRGVSIL